MTPLCILRMPFKHPHPFCNRRSSIYLTHYHSAYLHVKFSTSACAETGVYKKLNSAYRMHQQGVSIPRDDLYDLVQYCTRETDLNVARCVHSLMICNALDTVTVLGDHLIRMFCACGCLLEASHAFQRVVLPSAYTWNALISAQVILGESERAFELYFQMQLEGTLPDKVTILYILKACIHIQNIFFGRVIHEQLTESGYEADKILCSAVIDMYGKIGNIEDGRTVFDKLHGRDVVVWGAMLAVYTEQGHGLATLQLFVKMQEEGTEANTPILACLFKACSNMYDVVKGRLIHHYVISQHLDSEAVIGNILIDMYAKGGDLEDAKCVFLGLSTRQMVSWTLLINGYVHHGESNHALQLFEAMKDVNENPNEVIFSSILRACASTYDVGLGRLIHDQIMKAGVESDEKIGGALVDMYAKCKILEDAHKVFDSSGSMSEISWSALIGGYASHDNGYLALEILETMQGKGIKPTKSVLLSALKASANARAIEMGRQLHDSVLRMGLDGNVETASTLLDMYSKCGSVEEAYKVFQIMPEHDMVSWSAMIGGYADCGYDHAVLSHFLQMQEEGIQPDNVIYLCVLKSCGSSVSLGQGRLIHHEVIKSDSALDIAVGSSLVDMYAKCGSLDEAYWVFSNLRCRDVVAWSALIAGYVQHKHCITGFEFFKQMQEEGIRPNESLCSCMVKACENIQLSDQSMLVHAQIVECGFDLEVAMGSALVSMYTMGGSVLDASSVFNKLYNRDVVSWSAMITGYVLHDYFFSALELYKKMQLEGIRPDTVIFLSLLKACTGIGASGHGKLIHKHIIIMGFEADVDCGTALVDMYVKCGCLEDASQVSIALPIHNIVAWSAMMPKHGNQGNVETGKHCIESMEQQGVKPDDVVFLEILTACSQAGLLEEGQHYFNFMRENLNKLPDTKHFNCLADILSRAGHLREAQDLLRCIPLAPDIIGWLSLLSGCKTHYSVDLGAWCYENAINMNQLDASGYVLMSNVYSNVHTEKMADSTQRSRSELELVYRDQYCA